MTYGEDSKGSWILPQKSAAGWLGLRTSPKVLKARTSPRCPGFGGFGHVARLVIAGGQNEETDECAIMRAKTNITKGRGAFKYKIETAHIKNRKGEQIETSSIKWLEGDERSARAVLDDMEPEEGRGDSGKLKQAEESLTIALSKGPKPSKILEQESGVSIKTLNRAKRNLGIISNQLLREWHWALPEPPATLPEGLSAQVINGELVLASDGSQVVKGA